MLKYVTLAEVLGRWEQGENKKGKPLVSQDRSILIKKKQRPHEEAKEKKILSLAFHD